MVKVLRELPKADVLKEIGKALDKTAMLFQIPNWNQINTIVLSEWVYENYKNDQIKDVIAAIQVPPVGQEKVWRLTPDTIQEWMAFYLEKNSEAKEKRYNEWKLREQEKYQNTENQWTDERLKEILDIINNSDGPKKVPDITEKEIQEEGQEKPKKKNYSPPTKEYLVMKELHIEWSRKYHYLELLPPDNKKPDWISFEEFLNLPE